MSDPHRPEGFDPTRQGTGPTQASPVSYPPYDDPAYAGQLPTYDTGYQPPRTQPPNTQSTQRARAPGHPPPGGPPAAGPVDGGDAGPPEPPLSPRWLWLLAGAAVLLVVGLVIALLIANGSTKQPTAVPPLPTPFSQPSTTAPTQVPATTTQPPSPTGTPPPAGPPTTETTSPGAADVVYSVSGQGRAISIAYIDAGGVLQTEFNVVLPWSKQVNLMPSASKSASVTVVNIGEQITCSVSVDGAQVRQRTGTILTICAVAG